MSGSQQAPKAGATAANAGQKPDVSSYFLHLKTYTLTESSIGRGRPESYGTSTPTTRPLFSWCPSAGERRPTHARPLSGLDRGTSRTVPSVATSLSPGGPRPRQRVSAQRGGGVRKSPPWSTTSRATFVCRRPRATKSRSLSTCST